MDIRVPRAQVSDGEFRVTVNGSGMRKSHEPFAIISLSDSLGIDLDSAADCDRLIRAAVEAKRYLEAAVVPHAFRPGESAGYRCHECTVHEHHHVDAPEDAEPEPERVPWPAGLCGHPVTPGAWSQGFATCRDCLSETGTLDAYDRATAGEQLPVAAPAPAPGGEPRCECSHAQDEHDDADDSDAGPARHGCLHPGCGCLLWRLAGPKARREPPRVVPGSVEPPAPQPKAAFRAVTPAVSS